MPDVQEGMSTSPAERRGDGPSSDGPRRRDRYYLAHVDDDGGYRELYLLAGPLGARGGYRLTPQGWEPDELPVQWMVGGADHLDPIPDHWARRQAGDLGIDDRIFDRPTRLLR